MTRLTKDLLALASVDSHHKVLTQSSRPGEACP